MVGLSATEDRICQHSKEHAKLSLDEFLDCDTQAKGCKGGDVTKVLNYGKRKGFVTKDCYPERLGTCPEEHFTENSCREDKNIYRIIDHCLADGVEGVKKEILKNGPVIAMIAPNTDFLTFGSGVYQRSQDSFQLKGYHIVKVVGWTNIKESDVWIIENTWGSDWGEDGFGKIIVGDSLIDSFALGFAVIPIPIKEWEELRRAQDA
jgi:cathepsin B